MTLDMSTDVTVLDVKEEIIHVYVREENKKYAYADAIHFSIKQMREGKLHIP